MECISRDSQEKQYEIQGTVAPGFEPVRAMFEQHFQDGVEDKAQVCAYVRGLKVVDLWGQKKLNQGKEEPTYGFDGLQNICSSGKSLTALVVAMLAEGVAPNGKRRGFVASMFELVLTNFNVRPVNIQNRIPTRP